MVIDLLSEYGDLGIVEVIFRLRSLKLGNQILGTRLFNPGHIHQLVIIDRLAHRRIEKLFFNSRVNGELVADSCDDARFFIIAALIFEGLEFGKEPRDAFMVCHQKSDGILIGVICGGGGRRFRFAGHVDSSDQRRIDISLRMAVPGNSGDETLGGGVISSRHGHQKPRIGFA